MILVTDPSPTLSASQRAGNLRNLELEIINLAGGSAVLDVPTIVKEEVNYALSSGPVGLTNSRGTSDLREAVSKLLNEELSLDADPGEIIVTVGAKEAVMAIIMAFVEPGDEVLLANPSWVSYEPWIRRAGGTPIFFSMGKEHGYRPDWSEVSTQISNKTKLLIITTPHNPTGTTLRKDELEDLANLVNKYSFPILSDESNSRLVYNGRRYVSPSQIPVLRDRTILVRSFSKDYAMGGWRIGFIWTSQPWGNRILSVHQHAVSCVPSFIQAGALALLRWSQRTEFIQNILSAYTVRRKIMVDGLNQIHGVQCNNPEGTFNVFPDFSSFGLPSLPLASELFEKFGISTVHGSAFGSLGEGHLRMAFTLPPEKLEEALQRMANYFDNLL